MNGHVEKEAWDRIDVSDWVVRSVEQRGSSRNLWLEEPGTESQEEPGTESQWLHKDTVIPSNGIEQGEDWSEVVSTQVAKLLGVPCARTRMCSRGGRRGSISQSFLRKWHSLNVGTVVMERAAVAGYYRHVEGQAGIDPARPRVRRPGHSLPNIRVALQEVLAPPDFEGSQAMDGFDVFAGYIVLDALIANRDRHEENWAVLTPQLTTSPERLAPSYDHASSLGFNLTDDKRRTYLGSSGQLRVWAEKGTAVRFEHQDHPPTLVQHAAEAIKLCSSTGAHWWHQQIENVSLEPVLLPLRERAVPGMSDAAATFADNLLNLNLGRLRDAIRHTA
jgi:hypothetical protein